MENGDGSKPRTGTLRYANENAENMLPTLEELKGVGARLSSYRNQESRPIGQVAPKARLSEFHDKVQPVLKRACVECHGADTQEGNLRIDSLDPDLFQGIDVSWWLEVLAVLSNGEMPPPDEGELTDADRSTVIQWLSSEIQLASAVRRAEKGHSSFRRMTRYEYKYALQDLLGLPFDFAKDLPPESASVDGFLNSSETLHMSATQFATYRASSRKALDRAIVTGDRPEQLHWGISMKDAAVEAWTKQDEQLEELRQKHKDDPQRLKLELERQTARFRDQSNRTHYKDLTTGRTGRVSWSYGGAKYAWSPSKVAASIPSDFDQVVVIPPKQKLIVELGDQIPERGTLRVRIRASRTSGDDPHIPSLQLEFGWQASNDSAASVRISPHDLLIEAAPDRPQLYQWDVPLSEIYPRNSVRKISKMGDLPSPSEFLKLVNSSVSAGDVQLDYVEITAPVIEQWPPDSHNRIFIDSADKSNETSYAREVLTNFMARAWRRCASAAEIDQKLNLFRAIRPKCGSFQDAMTETLSTVLASPNFLYITQADSEDPRTSDLRPYELATRLSMFLWCSTPDEDLLDLAAADKLGDDQVLTGQVERMLADPRSRRFSRHFVRQWLGLQLLDYLDVDRDAYPQFDPSLKEAMEKEPVDYFHQILQNNQSVLDFIHSNYTMANERLAQHYGLDGVYGNQMRRVKLEPQLKRGGLLTHAGLLAMNSDGKDSHPLKRGIWLLESLLNDPPPPPPPAVPEIDLTDPEIAKLTLKERIEDHRNHAACMSCHQKIDPWGIAFESFDATGSWRTQINGIPVDASSRLFNGQKLDGMQGLKRYLLKNRQDQFVRALVHKMTTYALGRPLTFGDHSGIDQITADVRRHQDGLATMVTLIATSELFRAR